MQQLPRPTALAGVTKVTLRFTSILLYCFSLFTVTYLFSGLIRKKKKLIIEGKKERKEERKRKEKKKQGQTTLAYCQAVLAQLS